jgi:hypothetical protein
LAQDLRRLSLARPPDGQSAALAPNEGEVMRQHDQAQRYHPETQDRQEAENTAEQQHCTKRNPPGPGLRQRQAPRADNQFMRGCIDAEFFRLLRFCHSHLSNSRAQPTKDGNFGIPLQEGTFLHMGVLHSQTRLCTFFEKPLGKSEKHLY